MLYSDPDPNCYTCIQIRILIVYMYSDPDPNCYIQIQILIVTRIFRLATLILSFRLQLVTGLRFQTKILKAASIIGVIYIADQNVLTL